MKKKLWEGSEGELGKRVDPTEGGDGLGREGGLELGGHARDEERDRGVGRVGGDEDVLAVGSEEGGIGDQGGGVGGIDAGGAGGDELGGVGDDVVALVSDDGGGGVEDGDAAEAVDAAAVRVRLPVLVVGGVLFAHHW